MSTEISLNCQLLCASACAYYINNYEGTYNPPAGDPYARSIRWLAGAPTAIVGGVFNENAVLVGKVNLQTEAGLKESIVIAFQGTTPPTNPSGILDWFLNIMDEPVSASGNIPGLVHKGMLKSVNDLAGGIQREVFTLQQQGNGNYPVYVTGHSKGAGMASIYAALVYAGIISSQVPKAVYTFASPMVGNADFVNNFPPSISVIRYENYLDMVPFLAPSSQFMAQLNAARNSIYTLPLDALILAFETGGYIDNSWNYIPLGVLNFINQDGSVTIINSPPNTPNPCGSDIANSLANFSAGWLNVLDAHTHTCGYGYMNGTCNQMGVCGVA